MLLLLLRYTQTQTAWGEYYSTQETNKQRKKEREKASNVKQNYTSLKYFFLLTLFWCHFLLVELYP